MQTSRNGRRKGICTWLVMRLRSLWAHESRLVSRLLPHVTSSKLQKDKMR
jgi:hypothetical protein